ncbi:hypothetical protein KSX_51600 [Ktedonospora formicarum]|uniref:HEAT repeat domain-containing protein n=1 Tax=Ktedonospora formicarum TaxID=2778364 RepID=A0A8J3HZB5_9CHLR|nr:hypothetical protein KSX_51600 [Ktedonospora formicarum]
MVRKEALEALEQREEPIALGPVVVALQDKEEDVRLAALRVLGKQKERVPIEPVVSALKDSCEAVRTEASNLLGHLGSEVLWRLTTRLPERSRLRGSDVTQRQLSLRWKNVAAKLAAAQAALANAFHNWRLRTTKRGNNMIVASMLPDDFWVRPVKMDDLEAVVRVQNVQEMVDLGSCSQIEKALNGTGRSILLTSKRICGL